MVVPCCNPHDTYLSVCFYTPSFSTVYRFFFFNLLCCTPPVMLVHPDRLRLLLLLCMACPVLVQLAQLFLLWGISPIPYISISFWILSLHQEIYPSLVSLPLLACLKSFLLYCLAWTYPIFSSVYYCNWVQLSLLTTQQANKSKDKVLRQGIDFIWRADWPRRWQTNVSK